MMGQSRKDTSGFTLLEILVALFILVLVMSLIYSSFTGTLTQIDQVEKEAKMYQMARITAERIREDLACSFLEPDGVFGFQGNNEQIDGRDADDILFLSAKHLILEAKEENGPNPYVGPALISFYIMENDKEGDQGLTLYRSDTPVSEDPPEEKTNGLVLCENLFSFNFVYYDNNGDAYEEWDSSDGVWKDKLPSRVDIQLAFVNPDDPGNPLRFETGIAIPLAEASP
jgi:prepilin-type N-terminal cleavage/methylation domain-containing protein